ncbi:hypothetical protein FRC01_000597 [Tulasnella sp. 417]|nr:hypothetical protein FRC01_000597 [Tulasnella sp. 417]
MASLGPHQMPLHNQYPLLFQPNESVTQQKAHALFQRLQQLRAMGQTEANPEVFQLIRFIEHFKRSAGQAQQQQQQRMPPAPPPLQQPPTLNGVDHQAAPSTPAGAPVPPFSPEPPADPVTFSQPQLDALRAQIHAFKLIQRGMPIPPEIRDAVHPADRSAAEIKQEVDGKTVPNRVVDSAVQIQKAEEDGQNEHTGPKVAFPKGPRLEENTESAIYPYNAYIHPLDHLKHRSHPNQLHASKQQHLLIPSLLPKGLDPYQLLAERNRYIDARIAHRIQELSELTSTMGIGGVEPSIDTEDMDEDAALTRPNHIASTAHGKLRALIELKSLQLRDKQRALRQAVVARLGEATILPGDRKEYKRFRKQNIRDVRQTESLERRQRVEREKRVKQKHLDYLKTICDHGKAMLDANRLAQGKSLKLARAVLKYHVDTEKEEQKRIERISKERLKALKNDDEEAYLKLIDTAKDTRITHLLRQTDSYLDSLAQAVRDQQRDDQPKSGGQVVDESTFGASRMEDEDTVNADDDADAEKKKKVDYYSIAHRIQERVTSQPSILVGGTLKEYQIKGLQWMGLGKTIQTISLVTFLIERKHQPGPYLVIVPLSTLPNWTLEFEKWAPSVPTVVYKGSPAARKSIQNRVRVEPFKVMLTTFEYIIKDRPFLSKYKWVHMIIDEGHRMKNTQSKLAQTLTQYYSARYRLILTGTPLQNNLPELWALLNFALPKVFNSVKSFDEWFNTPFANSGAQDNIQLNEEESLLIIRRLHKVLRPFLLRRLKKDVESELPDKVEKVIKCKMSALQSQLYKYMKEFKMFPNDKPDVNGRPAPVKGLQNMVMQLRKICQHPFVFREVEDAMNLVPMQGAIRATAKWNATLIRTAGKVALLDRMLPKLFATGHRVLIFFQMTNVMDILEDYMAHKGVKSLRLDGGTKTEERGELLKKFNDPNSEYKVFMLSTRAGGLGLNLQTADTVIIYDSDWNPHADLQAQDRAHRIGQKKAVRIFRFVTEKSVEEAILTRARSKLDMDEKVIQAGRFDNKSTAEEREEYLRQLLEDQDDESQDQTGDITDEELNELLARTDDEQLIFRQMDIEREAREQSEWFAAGGVGPKPERLVTLPEIPAVYQQDDPFPKIDPDDVIEGRGARVRKDVRYTDGLTDEQFANAIENDEIDYEEYVEQNYQAKAKRSARKVAGMQNSEQSTPAPEFDIPQKKAGRGRGRGRPSGKNTPHEASPMPSKRKRVKEMSLTPSADDDEDDDDDKPSKRRRTQPLASSSTTSVNTIPPARQSMKKLFDECIKTVVNLTDETGRKRCELFKELPSKKEYPDYYEVIAKPISIAQIRRKSSGATYKDIEAFANDWRLLFDNARRYNKEGSWVYNDADEMQKVFESTYRRLAASFDTNGGGGTNVGSVASSSAPVSVPVSDDEDVPVRKAAARRGRVQSDSEESWQGDD